MAFSTSEGLSVADTPEPLTPATDESIAWQPASNIASSPVRGGRSWLTRRARRQSAAAPGVSPASSLIWPDRSRHSPIRAR